MRTPWMPLPELSEVRAVPSQLVDAETSTDGPLSATRFLSARDDKGLRPPSDAGQRRAAEWRCSCRSRHPGKAIKLTMNS